MGRVTTFFQEVSRRNVARVTLAYLAVSWLFTQVADIVLPTFGVGTWVMQALIVLFIAGLPVVVILAWVYDLTPKGVKRTDDVASPGTIDTPGRTQTRFRHYRGVVTCSYSGGYRPVHYSGRRRSGWAPAR